MADDDIDWPVGTTDRDPDLADRPLVFHPRGFLVAILPGPEEAERAAGALRTAGFADRKLRIFTGEQILADYGRYIAQMSLTRRVTAAVTDDRETLDLYHGHARDGRAALWVHVIDDDEANRAIRGLRLSHAAHPALRPAPAERLRPPAPHVLNDPVNDERRRSRWRPRSPTRSQTRPARPRAARP